MDEQVSEADSKLWLLILATAFIPLIIVVTGIDRLDVPVRCNHVLLTYLGHLGTSNLSKVNHPSRHECP